MNQIELRWMSWLGNTVGCGFLDTVMPIITLFGEYGIFFIAIAFILLCQKKTRKTGVALSLAMIASLLIGNVIIKNVVGRTRPYDLCDVTLLVPRLFDYSFPSGHTLVCFEAASVFFFMRKRKAALLSFLLAAAVGFSRIYLFVHYPTDVLGGALIGIGIGYLAVLSVKAMARNDVWHINRIWVADE